MREIQSCQFLDQPPIFVQPLDESLDNVIALIMAPADCPYHCGFYAFRLHYPATYPNEPPQVKFLTTGGGRTRMNPNLYADGKVCLSILGTWRGETAEVWRSSFSTMYILNAIQAAILVNEPYYNEPGFDKERRPIAFSDKKYAQTAHREKFEKMFAEQDAEALEYSKKIHHESLRVSVCEVLECLMELPPLPDALEDARSKKATPEKPRKRDSSGEFEEEQEQEGKDMNENVEGDEWEEEQQDEQQAQAQPTATAVSSPNTTSNTNSTEKKKKKFTIKTGTAFLDSASSSSSPNDAHKKALKQQQLDMKKEMRYLDHHYQQPHFLSKYEAAAMRPFLILFEDEIKRLFLTRFESYCEICTRFLNEAKKEHDNEEEEAEDGTTSATEGRSFKRVPFEVPSNGAFGRFSWTLLLKRLQRIYDELQKETEGWKDAGKESTRQSSYIACSLRSEAERTSRAGVSCSPLDAASNLFVWRATLTELGETVYEEAMYCVEIVYPQEEDRPPRVRFLQPIYHPNISASGFPLYFLKEKSVPLSDRYKPQTIVKMVTDLLRQEPHSNPFHYLNPVAANQCFSRDAAQQKMYKREARKQGRASADNFPV